MNHELLLKFTGLDDQVFARLMHHLGFVAAACYRVEQQKLVLFFGTSLGESEKWPVTVQFDNSYYNANPERGLPLGWVKPKLKAADRRTWPKGIIAYYPEQESEAIKLVMFVVPSRRRSYTQGELDGNFEVILKRICSWVNSGDSHNFVNETLFSEHIRKVGLEMLTLIDHELRTPLSIIAGYAMQLKSMNEDPALLSQFRVVIEEQTNLGIKAVEKLGLVLKSSTNEKVVEDELQATDLSVMARQICQTIGDDVSAVGMQGKRPTFSLVEPRDAKILVKAVPKLLERAIAEVVQNAVIHSQKGQIRITAYQSDDLGILDIEDDGLNVPIGSEELIFLRFFQGANVMKARRGHRGLGLGLFLARHIAELHMGQLNYIRQTNKGAVFRFMWPTSEIKGQGSEDLSNEVKRKKAS